MISIVVCSVDVDLFNRLSENIHLSIGLPHEIIRIDNTRNDYGICSAYNEGAQKAKFDIVCFCHEDIIMHTKQWGSIVQQIFDQHPAIGLLGISGSKYKAFTPSGWGSIPRSRYVNLIQHYKHGDSSSILDRQNPDNAILPRVVCIDGVFMCTRRSIVLANPFDHHIFTGFHCYDLDYCFTLLGKHEIAVTFDILLEHLSEGRNDADWIINTMKFHQKWKHALPANISTLSKRIIRKYEFLGVKYFMKRMIACNFSSASIMQMIHYNTDNPYLSTAQLKRFKIRVVKRFVLTKAARLK